MVQLSSAQECVGLRKKMIISGRVFLRALPSKCRYPHSLSPAKIPLSSWSPVTSLQLASPAGLPGAYTNGDAGTEMLVRDRALGKVLVVASIVPFLEE